MREMIDHSVLRVYQFSMKMFWSFWTLWAFVIVYLNTRIDNNPSRVLFRFFNDNFSVCTIRNFQKQLLSSILLLYHTVQTIYSRNVYRNNEYLVHNYCYYNHCGRLVKPFIHSFFSFFVLRKTVKGPTNKLDHLLHFRVLPFSFQS